MWSPGGPSNLNDMKDGVGYWIHMNQDAELVIHGYQLPKAGGGCLSIRSTPTGT